MIERKLEEIRGKLDELNAFLAQPDAMADPARWRAALKEQSELAPVAAKADEYDAALRDCSDLEEALASGDHELEELARDEKPRAEERLARLTEEIREMLLPRDPNDDRNVVMEIRAGTGGEEAALFAADLMRMYMRYAERKGLRAELTDLNETEIGGCKEATLVISGRGAFRLLKYESGAHRVQRVPETESGGRIHTSAATVAVLPEAEEVELEINPADLRIDTYRSSGAGGQHVNKTDSAIRITHLPTGLVVTCQDEKSQTKNKAKALRVLRSRLYDKRQSEMDAEYAAVRRNQVGSGDRSERIRTYNFPQGRVTDHRIGVTLYKLDAFMQGDMDPIIEPLIIAERTQRMQRE
ncbi:MAG: peptide chain release factor 1 [Clostridiales bacterium]|nr:peptide chain release factor 1 [Clostridiales bacterium]